MDNETTIHPPHPPTSSAQTTGRVGHHHPPRPFYKKGGRADDVSRPGRPSAHKEKPGGWIPPELQLSDTPDEIEGGRVEQPGDTIAGRLARLLDIPGVQLASAMEAAT